MFLVDYARDVVGLPMGGASQNRHIGWTTDEAKASAMRDAGAHVITVHSSFLGPVSKTDRAGRVIGYEVSFAVGREYEERAAA